MKKFILPFIACIVLSSCLTDDDGTNQVTEPLVITKADYELNYRPGGETYTFFTTSDANVTIPVSGEDQTWDFSDLSECCSAVFGGSEFLVPSDPAFPSATYSEELTGYYSISGVESNDYEGERFYEVNDNGIYGLGLLKKNLLALLLKLLVL